VKPVVGTKELLFEPGLQEIRDLVQLCFEKIIEVNQKLPRIDCLLFPGMCVMNEGRQFFNILVYNLLCFLFSMIVIVFYVDESYPHNRPWRPVRL
jgi:hypothetical protein